MFLDVWLRSVISQTKKTEYPGAKSYFHPCRPRLPPMNLSPDSHFQELGLGWISLDFANPGLLPAQEPWAIR